MDPTLTETNLVCAFRRKCEPCRVYLTEHQLSGLRPFLPPLTPTPFLLRPRDYTTKAPAEESRPPVLSSSQARATLRWLEQHHLCALANNWVKGGTAICWIDTFSRFNFRIKHISGVKNILPDALLQRLDMLDATDSDSEFRQGPEYEPQYPLDPSLPKVQVLNVYKDPTLTETDPLCALKRSC